MLRIHESGFRRGISEKAASKDSIEPITPS